jgi:hypothetical protein
MLTCYKHCHVSDLSVGEIENHGSVVSHLISQVKIGMDLTKVVLPTFILERRSLLEMYADYFAHPDVFIRYVIACCYLKNSSKSNAIHL